MIEQMAMFDMPPKDNTDTNKKRRWEAAFQKWSNEQAKDGKTPLGKCGYGDCCDWCGDNSYGRPCVRAYNAMCREKGIKTDYDNYNFDEVW